MGGGLIIVVGDGSGGGARKSSSPSPTSKGKKNMDNMQAMAQEETQETPKENMAEKSFTIPMSMVPEGAEVGSMLRLEGEIKSVDGETATLGCEKYELIASKETEPSEEDARTYAKQMDEEMGYAD
jgi:hypothetical protein